MRSLLVGLLGSVSLLALALAQPSPSLNSQSSANQPIDRPGASGKRDRVAYTTFRPGNWDIYLFEQGKSPRRLTSHAAPDYGPVVSPDGRWLVFCSERRGNSDLYVLDLKDRGEPRLLIESDALEDQPAFSPDGTSIAFVSTFSGNADIYLLRFRPDRTALMAEAENVTHHMSGDFRPAFSPDGRSLAFSSDRDLPINAISPIIRLRDGDLYKLELQDSRLTRLTNAPGWDGSPAWSPDGKTIVYYHAQPRTAATWRATTSQIWSMNADGTNQGVLTPNEATALSPTFLGDGRIAYSRKPADRAHWQIVSIKADGSEERIESDPSSNDYWAPSWGHSAGMLVAHGTGPYSSADDVVRTPWTANIGEGPFLAAGAPFGKRLPDREIELYPIRFFTALLNPKKDLVLLTTPPGGTELLVSRQDGSQPRKVLQYDKTQNGFASLSWSRDGEWIAFTRGNSRNRDADADIWRIRPDGSEPQNLTPNSPGNDSSPSFSGDDSRIVFRSKRGGQVDLYVMAADGNDVRRVTNSADDKVFPIFSPVANQIAFLSDRDKPGSTVYEIYLLDLTSDGSPERLQRITHNDVQEGHLAFSYDGKWLIFTSEQGGINDEEPLVQAILFSPQSYGDMYAYRLQDGTTVRLTHNKWEEGVPSWEAPLPR